MALLPLRRRSGLLLLPPWLAPPHGRSEAQFAGWFGPMAVSAVYYAALAGERLEKPVVWNVVSPAGCSSVLVHGVTCAPFTRLLGRVEQRQADAPADKQ